MLWLSSRPDEPQFGDGRDFGLDLESAIDAIYHCLHEHSRCGCLKPAVGMLLDAARDHAIDLAASWMIDDSDHDIAAGKRAGCKTVRLAAKDQKANLVAASLLDAVHQILTQEEAAETGAASREPISST
jgi:D-glycero-D-manno-heptose 1,7-bisphosphate phosphatase